MGTHAIDSFLFGQIFGDDRGRQIWNDTATLQLWMDIEAALAQAQADIGLIPSEAAEEIKAKASVDFIDINAFAQEVTHTEHLLVPFLRQFANACSGGAGKYLHWGATTQNILDTAAVLQTRETHDAILGDLTAIEAVLISMARQHRDTVMAGRTHGQHAVPITFGFKVAAWLSEISRHVDRLQECEGRVFVGVLGGGAGTLAAMGDQGIAVKDRMMELLGLGSPEIPVRTAHDGVAEYMCLLGMIAATAEKVAQEIYLLQRTEIAEVEEPFHLGKVGSSTMPQKRNPSRCAALIGAARAVRANVPLALEGMCRQGEGDSASSRASWLYVPESSVLALGVVSTLRGILEGLVVYPMNMLRNLDRSGGLMLAEALMMKLAESTGRQRAHDIVYEAAMEAIDGEVSLKDVVLSRDDITDTLDTRVIEDILRFENYLGLCQTFVDQVTTRLDGRWLQDGHGRTASGSPGSQPRKTQS